MPSLKWIKAEGRPQVFPVYKKITSIGRAGGNDVAIREGDLADYHAQVVFDGKEFTLSEVDRKGELRINGKKKRRGKVLHGDRLTVGDVELQFSIFEEVTGLDEGEPGHCRFAVKLEGEERIYEMQVFPLGADHDGQRVMNLYVDRTAGLVNERRLILAERLASLGRVTQGVAHELNTPLATIRTLAADMVAALKQSGGDPQQPMLDDLLDDLSESAALVHDETRRLGRITQGLLTGRDLTASEIDGAVPLGAVVERARALVFAGARKNVPVAVGAELSAHTVAADPDHLVQVMVNLLQNAYDAVREGTRGGVRVSARRDGPRVEIVIDDDGPGVPTEIEGRLFEPFATTKPPGKGTGLGLYTSYMLVTSMNGTMSLENREGGGARAVVALPAAGERGERLVQIGRSPEAAE